MGKPSQALAHSRHFEGTEPTASLNNGNRHSSLRWTSLCHATTLGASGGTISFIEVNTIREKELQVSSPINLIFNNKRKAMSLKEVARQTLKILDAGSYTSDSGRQVEFGAPLQRSIQGTKLYTPARLAELLERGFVKKETDSPRIEITDETTQVAAQRLCAEGATDLVLLNFASARNHGGGFVNGAKAQEEDLCRCSGLYPCLLAEQVQPYYAINRGQRSLLYTDHAIYSPEVPWIRTHGRGPLLDEPFYSAVITMPAPNAGPILRRDPEAGPAIAETFERRWGQVLAIAAQEGHTTLLLGAWGCGAFGNDPAVAARAFSAWRDHLDGAFQRIIFAIPNRGKRGARNHAAFARTLTPN